MMEHEVSTDLGLSPSHQRKRSQKDASIDDGSGDKRKLHKVSRACDTCKAKKARCSGTQPCQSCLKKGTLCVYAAKYSRGRPPTPPPGPTSASTGPSPVDGPRDGMELRTPLPRHASQSQTPHTGDDRRSDTPAYANEEMGGPSRASPEVEAAEIIEGQYFDTTSGLTFLHRAYKRFSTQKGDVTPQTLTGHEMHQPLMSAGDTPFLLEEGSSSEGATQVPGRAVADELVAFYFDVCVVTYPIFHRQTTQGWLDTMMTNAEQGRDPMHRLGNAKAAVLFTIMAIAAYRREKIGSRSSTEASEADRLRLSDPYFRTASRLTDAETGLPRLESAQARLVQVLYLLQTSRMNQGWYVFGTTAQVISALGLHRRSAKRRKGGGGGSGTDYVVSQCRRRVFWVAYTIDKYLSVVFGRPRHYHDDSIDQDFPDCVNDEDMTAQGPTSTDPLQDCHIDALIFHAKLAQILETISQTVYSIQRSLPAAGRTVAARRATADLQDWRTALPAHLGTVRPSSLIPAFRRQATALRLAYHHAVLHANRPFLLSSAAGDDGVAECIAAARAVLETFDGMAGARDGSLFYSLWWSHYVAFCALAVVYVWEIRQQRQGGRRRHGEQREEEEEEEKDKELARLVDLAERCRGHLARSTAANSPSRRYSIILEELRSEARLPAGPDPLAEQVRLVGAGGVGGAEPAGTGGLMAAGLSHFGSKDVDPLGGGFAGEQQQRDLGIDRMNTLLVGWETSDWLDLDSSAFLPYTDWSVDGSPVQWMPDAG